MSRKSKVRPSFSFERWLLLYNAILSFNKFQRERGGSEIDVSNCNKIGEKIGLYNHYWVMHDLGDRSLERDWLDFIADPNNKVIFTEAQLLGEDTK